MGRSQEGRVRGFGGRRGIQRTFRRFSGFSILSNSSSQSGRPVLVWAFSPVIWSCPSGFPSLISCNAYWNRKYRVNWLNVITIQMRVKLILDMESRSFKKPRDSYLYNFLISSHDREQAYLKADSPEVPLAESGSQVDVDIQKPFPFLLLLVWRGGVLCERVNHCCWLPPPILPLRYRGSNLSVDRMVTWVVSILNRGVAQMFRLWSTTRICVRTIRLWVPHGYVLGPFDYGVPQGYV